ncbi:ABC transporter substrate-binding protein [Actinopolymorpha sp. NPDC004070]|uniref:ABC transporter substrate-binding protein n=1 Tax=Actinopolymorpha sp. NPDC004070 TaxID=3154548 RepID=UPI0033A066CD
MATTTASRRDVLRLSAAAAVAVTLSACSSAGEGGGSGGTGGRASGKAPPTGKGSLTKPPKVPRRLKEAPALAKRVRSGDLPPLAKRSPEQPYVVPHRWLSPGKYGGGLLLIGTSTEDGSNKEFMYGHSLLRWLNDGLDIGPGLVHSWEPNADSTEWTLHFRKGMRWSDGKPWTTADIMYWWQDLVLNKEHPEVPPDDVRSGTDTLAKFTAPDDHTLVLTFDAPAPVLPERLAAWVNRGNGATWMQPKHYVSQFHPKYNKAITSKSWFNTHDDKANWATNPDCPTMTGWRLATYREGRAVTFERNPYYWAVAPDGCQLPYLDTLTFTTVVDPQVRKLQVTEGKVDYCHGPFVGIGLPDVSSLKRSSKRSGMQVHLWNSGSGTGTLFFFNYDYPDAKLRTLIRNPKFRQALSYAYDREEVRKSVYFNTGEKTTGTTHPTAYEYLVNDTGRKTYARWRDSYLTYDPDKAKSMLDDLGVVDRDGDGKRELPDGSRLRITLDYPADTDRTNIVKNDVIKKNWRAIGIDTELNPVPPTTFGERWEAGRLMSYTTWEVSDTPLIYPAPVVPVPPAHWAPLHAQGFALQTADPGKLKAQAHEDPWKRQPPWLLAEPDTPIDRLWKLYRKGRVETDRMKQIRLLWEIYKVHIEEGPFLMGCVADAPQVTVVHKDLRNVPARESLAAGGWVNAWTHPTPAVYDPEAFYWTNPDQHT